MKKILFICLLVCFSWNEVSDVANCLLNIPGYKEAAQQVVEAIQERDFKK